MATVRNLDNLSVFLSGSLPPNLYGTPRALDLQQFIVAFVDGLLAAGGRLVFGGHPSLTPLVERVARVHGAGRVDLYQWERFRGSEPPEAHSDAFNLHWIPGDDLTPMRELMVERSKAAVFLGGKTADEGPVGGKPGILDEYERFLKHHSTGPVYVLGLLDGDAARLAEAFEDHPNPLAPAERQLLGQTTDVDLAASLVLAGLRRQAAEQA